MEKRKEITDVIINSDDLMRVIDGHNSQPITMTDYLSTLMSQDPARVTIVGQRNKYTDELAGRLLVMSLTRDVQIRTDRTTYDRAHKLFHGNIEGSMETGYRVRPKPSKSIDFFSKR